MSEEARRKNRARNFFCRAFAAARDRISPASFAVRSRAGRPGIVHVHIFWSGGSRFYQDTLPKKPQYPSRMEISPVFQASPSPSSVWSRFSSCSRVLRYGQFLSLLLDTLEWSARAARVLVRDDRAGHQGFGNSRIFIRRGRKKGRCRLESVQARSVCRWAENPGPTLTGEGRKGAVGNLLRWLCSFTRPDTMSRDLTGFFLPPLFGRIGFSWHVGSMGLHCSRG